MEFMPWTVKQERLCERVAKIKKYQHPNLQETELDIDMNMT